MGQVFAATVLDSSIPEQVAIKVVSRLFVDEVLMVRLHREAEAAQRIQSDFVPRVFEVGDTDDGETFLVMERLVGESLSQRIRENGALPWGEVARIGEDVLRGLIDAHTAGIIHRDLKPSNVFLALKSGRIRAMVLDFGVCKMDGLDTERLTATGESIGTVAYMAPEQIRGAARVDERADLYAFGVLVFEMLSGRLPHDGPTQMAILASKLENVPSRLRESSRVAIPAGADELIVRALARDPAERFASAQDLLKAWRALSKTENLIATASTPPRPSAPTASGADLPTLPSGNEPPPIGEIADTEVGVIERVSLASDQTESSDYLPPEAHPTATSGTTHQPSIRRAQGRVRFGLVLAACGLVLAIVVVGVAFNRGRGASSARATAAPTPSIAAAASSVSEIAPSAELTTPSTSTEAPELVAAPPEPSTATPGTKPKHVRGRPRTQVTTAPKTSGPRITSQPRY